MTNKKFLMGVAALMLMANMVAHAMPSVRAVEAAMSRGDMPSADAMLQEVIAAKPNVAKAHYYYAQVLEREHKLQQAMTELNEAKRLDPSLKFAQPAKLIELQDELNAELRPITARQPAAPVRATPVKVHHVSKAVVFGILFGVLALGLVLLMFVFHLAKEADKRTQEEQERARKEALKQLNEMLETLNQAAIIAEADGHQGSALMRGIQALSDRVTDALEAVKAGQAISQADLTLLRRKAGELRQAAEQGRAAMAPAAVPDAPTARLPLDKGLAYPKDAPRAAPQPLYGRGPAAPQPVYPPTAPQPVVIHEHHDHYHGSSSGDGFLTGALVGAALASSGRHDRDGDTTIVNNYYGDAPQPVKTGSDWEAPAPVDTNFDYGRDTNESDGSDWSDSSSSGGSDSGSDDGGW